MATRPISCLLVASCLFSLPVAAADPLPAYNVDLDQSSVSGLSSGAYMAGQFHVAFSETLIGAGIVAGGPYDCAEGNLSTALNRCMETLIGVPDAARLIRRAEARAARGEIDPLSGLADDRVYVFAGTRDETVSAAVGAQAAVFYRKAGIAPDRVLFENAMPAGHAFLTEDRGNPCSATAAPYINDCDHDQAGILLGHIYGRLEPPASRPRGTVVEFDQSEFLPDPTAHGMAQSGFAFVPEPCAAGEPCRVHVAFHGCRQTHEAVGDAFFADTGYNRWADTNAMIVLYPQAHATPQNPNACWDWWGYDDPAYATRSGRQVAAVRAMLGRMSGESQPPAPSCQGFRDFNFAHWQAGRARICGWWFFCAVGSGERLGFAASASTLYEGTPGNYSTRACGS